LSLLSLPHLCANLFYVLCKLNDDDDDDDDDDNDDDNDDDDFLKVFSF